MKFLVTGFAPFGGEKVNPAWEAVKLLPATLPGARIITALLPTAFEQGARVLAEQIQLHEPDAVLCVGQAGGRPALAVERVAVNLVDARIADNEGNKPQDEAVIPGGPAAYFSNLPTRALVERLLAKGIPASLSYSAGTYVCNEVFYRLMHLVAVRYPKMLGGFIHVPYDTKQAARLPAPPPSLPVAIVAQGLQEAIIFLAAHARSTAQ